MNKVSTTQSSGAAVVRTQGGLVDLVKRLMRITELMILVAVIALIVIGAIVNPNFLHVENLKIMTRDTAILAIAAIGVGFTILTAGIDLSIGSMVAVGGVMLAYFMMNWQLPMVISIALVYIIALVVGTIHGLFVTKLRMHGFLITLVSMGVARGAMLVITNAFPITGLPRSFTFIGQGYVFDLIPIPVIICLAIAAITYYLLRFSYIGRQIYAAGGNIEAARLSGINVDARITLCYVISVLCAVTVGLIQAARMSMGHPGTGEGYELLAIAACILGGVSFMGGEGGIIGIMIGATMIGVLQNEMVMLNINPYWHKIVINLVLLAAITIDYARRRQRT